MRATDHHRSKFQCKPFLLSNYNVNRIIKPFFMNQKQTTEKVRVLTAGGNQIHETRPAASETFNNWDINSLIDFVIKHYHRDTRQGVITIYNLAQKVSGKHREKHPELAELTTALFLFFDDLLFHLKKEEQILFPNIIQLIKKKVPAEATTYTTFGLIKELSLVMQSEHRSVVRELKYFRRLTNNYMIPPDACRSYRHLFERMKEFERDLMVHMSVENDVLFPRAIQMDERFTEKERKERIWRNR